DEPPGAPAEPDSARATAAGQETELPAESRGRRLIRAGFGYRSGLVSRVETSLPVRCLLRFGAINGRDRALVLGGQAFTAVIPLLIVVSAVGSKQDSTAVADRLGAPFHRPGPRARG